MPIRQIRGEDYVKGLRNDRVWPANRAKWTKQKFAKQIRPASRSMSTMVKPWPDGGIFLPKKGRRENYDPTQHGPRILSDAQALANDPSKFVNRWGRLGVGIPDDDQCGYDGIENTKAHLALVKRWLEELQNKKKASLDNVAEELNIHLAWIHPEVCVSDGQLRPGWRLVRLWDVIILELWDSITKGGRMRCCRGCNGWFLPERTNRLYCTEQCRKRFGQRIRPKNRKHVSKLFPVI